MQKKLQPRKILRPPFSLGKEKSAAIKKAVEAAVVRVYGVKASGEPMLVRKRGAIKTPKKTFVGKDRHGRVNAAKEAKV